ncbi:MAG TPA: GNAT family N-acetyltransferase [Rudaea sp.]|nr:GNAT family N-acetyltransferase [Rudaea sp.]
MAEPVPDSIELNGDGLRLRPYRREDAGFLLAAARESVESVGRWLPWCHASYAAAEAEDWIARCAEGWRSGEHYAFAVFDADSAEFCGSVGLNQRNRAHNFMNLGYWIRASRQGQRIVRRAARQVTAFGFGHLGLTRVEVITAPDNHASRAVAEAIGAHFEGISRNRIVMHGRPVEAAVYALIP